MKINWWKITNLFRRGIIGALLINLVINMSNARAEIRLLSENCLAPVSLYQFQGIVYSLKLLSDPFGNTHMVWIERDPEKGDAIMYSYLDPMVSQPVDVMIGSNISYLDAAIDQNNTLHIAWVDGSVKYSRVSAIEANQVDHWRNPVSLDSQMSGKVSIQSTGDFIGVVYSLLQQPFGVNLVISEDLGETWSFPSTVYTPPDGEATSMASISINADGSVNIPFALVPLPNGYPPLGVWSIHSDDLGNTWIPVQNIVMGTYSDVSLITLDHEHVLMIISGTGLYRGWYSALSEDGGNSFSGISENFAPGIAGLSKPASIAIDSSEIVHIVMDSDSPQAAIIADWSSFNSWSEIQNISLTYGPEDGTIIGDPAITIHLGNELVITYVHQTDGIMLVRCTLATPAFTPVPTSTILLPLPAQTMEVLRTPTEVISEFHQEFTSPVQHSSVSTPILFSSALVILTILSVYWIYFRNKK